MITLKDIAQKAGVSVSTVSKILNDSDTQIPLSEETKLKVINAAKELNYFPNVFARYLRTKKSKIIGVEVYDITDPFFTNIIFGIEKYLTQNDYFFLLSSLHDDIKKEELYLSKFNKIQIDGLMILGGSLRLSEKRIKSLLKNDYPIVIVGRTSPHPAIGSVTVDNFEGAFKATEYLIGRGHIDILHITSNDNNRADAVERKNGYLQALKKNDLQNQSNVVKCGITAEDAYKLISEIIIKKKYSAVFAYNDMMAFGVIRAIKDYGLRIPEDIAVVGFDDLPIAKSFDPPLTTIRQPQVEMGIKGAEILLNAINNEKVGKDNINYIFNSLLMIRGSSEKKNIF